MIYLDNGATSFPKPKGMIQEMENCMLNYCGNPGRSGHYMSTKTGEEIYIARKEVASLLGATDSGNVVFTKNTTEALNLAIFSSVKKGDHIVSTSMEHNSVLRPLSALEKRGVSNTIVFGDEMGRVTPFQIEKAIKPETRLIAVTGASNLTGTKLPVKEIGQIARKRGILFLVDGAQLIGHEEFNMEENKVDMLAFAGHKALLGPQGTGGLCLGKRAKIRPLIYGGTGTESKSRVQPNEGPEAFESGTLNAPGIIGLGYGIRFVKKIGLEAIRFQEEELIKKLDEDLGNMKGVKVYGPEYSKRTGITAFNVMEKSSEEVTDTLGREYGIALRGGFHCAALAHKTIGTFQGGAVRVSVGPFNTRKDIGSLVDAIYKLLK